MEWEKSRTVFHIRGQNCLLATTSPTQFHYIYKIVNTRLFLPNHFKMRSRKSWELVAASSQQSSDVAPTILRYEKKTYISIH